VSDTVLIVGASRGIGLELARQYAAAGSVVHATTRTPDAPGALGGIEGTVHLHRLDVRDAEHVAALRARLEGVALDVLIHNAGVYSGSQAELTEVNTEAPLRLGDSFEGNVAAAEGALALMSSGMGARRGRRTSALGSYARSKAELNDGLRLRAARWADMGITAIVINPGWVRTDMGGSGAPLDVVTSVTGIRRLIDGLTPDMGGRFWSWDGTEHPW
jgi:NAD(P)-dependent dehydrogenase (short-subunit alcohol dehydrogenase family)